MKPIPPFLLPFLPTDRRSSLERFDGMLAARAVPLGFIGPGDAGSLWDRHIIDSMRGALCLPPEAATIADIGSGAGLPGIPLAMTRPDCTFTLIEPRARRAAFLEFVVEELGLANVEVRAASANRVGQVRFDVCLARAVAGPARSWALASPLLSPNGVLIYWAGMSWEASAVELPALSIRFEVCCPPSAEMSGPLVKMARGAPTNGPN